MFCSRQRCFKALGKNCIRVAGHHCSDHLYHSLSCYRQAMKSVEPKLRPSKGAICPRCQAISGSYIHVDFQPEPEVVQDELELGGEETVETVEMENGDEQQLTRNAETGQSSKEPEQNMNEQNDDDQSLENEEAEVSSTDERAGEIENEEEDNDGQESTGNQETEVSSEEEGNENEMEQEQNQAQNSPLVLQIVAEDQLEQENRPKILIQTIRGRRILDREWIHGPRPLNMALICDVCLKELPSTSRKFRHTEKHLEPVVCNFNGCKAFYTREDNLKRHIKNSH